jgi:outer membrane protein
MTKQILSILLILTIVSVIYATDQIPITMEEAMYKASSQNLTIQQMNQKMKNMELEEAIKNAAFFPTLQFNSSFSYNSKEAGLEFTPLPALVLQSKERYDASINIQQVLFAGFRVRESYLMSKNQYLAQSNLLESTRNQIRQGVGSLYYQIQATRLTHNILQQSRDRALNQLLFVRQLLNAKQAVPFDTLEVANRLLSIDTQIRRTQQSEEILLIKFNNLINDSTCIYSPIPFDLGRTPHLFGSLSIFLEQAKTKNTDMKQISLQKLSQDNMIRIQQSHLYPQLVSSFTYHEAKPGTNTFSNEWMNYYNIGIGFQWEIWNWKANYHKVEQQQIERQRMDLQEQQALQNLEQQVTETYKIIIMSLDQINLQQNLVEQESTRYTMLQDRFRESQVSALELSTGEKTFTEAQLNLQQQYINLNVYQLQMDILTGKFNSGEK